ncbi:MAG: hypothetical protein ACYCUI_09560 [Vulcanimicrobiaceae bacterium]
MTPQPTSASPSGRVAGGDPSAATGYPPPIGATRASNPLGHGVDDRSLRRYDWMRRARQVAWTRRPGLLPPAARPPAC